jgi:predicted Zn-dependent protease
MWRYRHGASAAGKEQKRMSEDRIEALKQLLEQEPHDTMLLFGLGNELLSLGHYTEAIPYFEEAVRVDPEYAAVYVYLARAYEESNQPDMVCRTLKRGWGPAVRSGDRNLMAEIEDMRERL